MIRLLLRLLKIKDFEPCASCEVIKAQLAMVNAEKRELLETLLKLVKPEVIHHNPPVIVNPATVHTTFARRKQVLEDSHRAASQTQATSPFIARPVDKSQPVGSVEMVDDMERRLGLNDPTPIENASKIS